MWLVICSATDSSARWAYEGLRRRGLEPLELVESETLALSLFLEHRLSNAGDSTRIALGDGRRISVDTVHGVLNRMAWVPCQHLPWVDEGDRDYAAQELNALFLSWLHAVPAPVVNQPSPMGLAGSWRHASEWACLAAAAALPTALYRQSSEPDEQHESKWPAAVAGTQASVLVMDGSVFGAALPAALQAGCVCLAALAGTRILGIDFEICATSGWTFADATPLPDLRLGGEACLDRLLDVLAAGTRHLESSVFQ